MAAKKKQAGGEIGEVAAAPTTREGKIASAEKAREEREAQILEQFPVGFIGSCTYEVRRRSDQVFTKVPHYYEGQPTPEMLDDAQLRIVPADGPGDIETIEEGMASIDAKHKERMRQLQDTGAGKHKHGRKKPGGPLTEMP